MTYANRYNDRQSITSSEAKIRQTRPRPRTPAPLYETRLGAAYIADSLDMLRSLPARTVNLVITSPPYALQRKKEYGNVDKRDYVEWMLPFAREIKRVLTNDGSFVLNIGGSYNKGFPTRSLYHFKLLICSVRRCEVPPRARGLLV
jgi:hypothetical protein